MSLQLAGASGSWLYGSWT